MRILASKFRSVVESRGAGEKANEAIVRDYGDGWLEVDTLHPSYPRRAPGLGDMVAAGLEAVGITKERVSAAIGRDCGCKGRQEALNAIGRRIGIG
jgi:hypothetical protein